MRIVITGTSRGIGLELTAQALRDGHHVLAIARAPDRSSGLQALKREYSDPLEILALDVTAADAPAKIANSVGNWSCVDVLINNAGVYAKGDSMEELVQGFVTNAAAPYLVTQALLPKLKQAKTPKAAQITSLMGSIGDNEGGGSYAYRASKAALNMLNKTISRDQRWLTTIVIHPGWVQTDMGGDEAPTSITESATGIWKVINALSAQDSGEFFDFEGDRLPW